MSSSKNVVSIGSTTAAFGFFGLLYSFILFLIKQPFPSYLPLSFVAIDIILSLLLLMGGLSILSLRSKLRVILLYLLNAIIIELIIKSFIIISKADSSSVIQDLLIFILTPFLLSFGLIISLTMKNVKATFTTKISLQEEGRISRSYRLLKESLTVLLKDKEMLLYPIMSLILALVITGGGAFLLYSFGFFERMLDKEVEIAKSIWLYAGLFIYYVIVYFIGIFFNAALVKCASVRLKGGNPTFNDGIKSSLQNIKVIFLWSIIAATVGVILQIIQEKSKGIGRMIGYFGNIMWAYATLFVVPILILEKENVLNSIKKSSKIFVQRWGESVIGNLGMGVLLGIFMVAGLISISVIAILLHIPLVLGVTIAVCYFFLIIAVSMAVNAIYITALYNYATTGEIAGGYSDDLLKDSFVPTPERKTIGKIRPPFGFRPPGFPGQEPGQI